MQALLSVPVTAIIDVGVHVIRLPFKTLNYILVSVD